MKTLSVRMEDDDFEQLQRRAEAAGASTTSEYVRSLIGSFGGSEVVPPPVSPEPESGSSAASLPPQAPIGMSIVHDPLDRPRELLIPPADTREPAETMIPQAVEQAVDDAMADSLGVERTVLPGFLAAPVDDCALCGHDRQASSHLGGQACKFKIGRRNCGCTFEGF